MFAFAVCLPTFQGDGINRMYFPVFVPVGVTGNILSFFVNHSLRFTFDLHEFAGQLKEVLVKALTPCRKNTHF